MTEAKPSAEIVRAWFDTVLNPLHDGLRNVLRYLESNNLVWRFRERRSMVIRPYRELLDPNVEPNVEQFLDSKPDLSATLRTYDEQVEELAKRLRTCNAAVLRNDKFLELMDRHLDEVVHLSIAPGEDLKNFLAEYVVNNIDHLADIYSTASFWNAHSAEFLACRELPDVKPYFDALYTAADRLGGLVRSVIDELRRSRNDLSYSHGVPIVSSISIR